MIAATASPLPQAVDSLCAAVDSLRATIERTGADAPTTVLGGITAVGRGRP